MATISLWNALLMLIVTSNLLVGVCCKLDDLFHEDMVEKENVENLVRANSPIIMRKKFFTERALRKLYREITKRNNHLRRTTSVEVDFEPANCAAYHTPVAVNLPPSSNGFYFPNVIILSRCGGNCAGNSIHCAPTTTQQVTGSVLHISYLDNTVSSMTVQMVNHTSCDCLCITQPSDCDSTQEFIEDTCSCQCKDLSHTCNSTIMQWDQNDCRCECISHPSICSNSEMIWDPDTCQCECLQSAQDSCTSNNMLMDPQTCSCS